MRTRNVTRVRWDVAERAQLVKQSQIVLSQRPGDSLRDIVTEAMLMLPPERRRKVDTKTVLWIREAVRGLPPLTRDAASKPEEEEPASEAVATDQPVAASAGSEDEQPIQSANPVTAALVESAVDVLVGVLTHPRLRMAVRSLLIQPVSSNADGTRGHVVVAGLQPRDAKTVEKTFEGMLPLRTWSNEQTREQLEAIIEDARLVIGMSDLTQAVDHSLSRLGSRYLRNRGGIQELHKRLADEAMK